MKTGKYLGTDIWTCVVEGDESRAKEEKTSDYHVDILFFLFYCCSVTVVPIYPPVLSPAHPLLPHSVLPLIVPVHGYFI